MDALETLRREWHDAAQKLRQFGRLLASRLLGTVPDTHGGYRGIVDLWEKSVFTRAEVNGLTKLIQQRLNISDAELLATWVEEYRHLLDEHAKQWPEITAETFGIGINDVKAFAGRAKREGWPR